MQELKITENEAGQRLDKLLGKFLKEAPKSFLYKMLRKKNITLNGKKATGQEKLAKGDVVKLFLADDTIEKFSGEQKKSVYPTTKLDVIYEDEHILLINKPVGMLSQKAKDSDLSAVEYVIGYLLSTGAITEAELKTFHPSICNRLDRNTSGLLAAGKSLVGLQVLSEMFRERSLAKYYRCLVAGQVTKGERIDGYLYKDEKTNKVQITSKELPGSSRIETEYRVVKSNQQMSLLEVHLITGKTHQIRAHLSSIGHPIIGDYKYGQKEVNDIFKKKYQLSSQLLHAYRLEFPELEGALEQVSEKVFCAEPPALFQKICKEIGE